MFYHAITLLDSVMKEIVKLLLALSFCKILLRPSRCSATIPLTARSFTCAVVDRKLYGT